MVCRQRQGEEAAKFLRSFLTLRCGRSLEELFLAGPLLALLALRRLALRLGSALPFLLDEALAGEASSPEAFGLGVCDWQALEAAVQKAAAHSQEGRDSRPTLAEADWRLLRSWKPWQVSRREKDFELFDAVSLARSLLVCAQLGEAASPAPCREASFLRRSLQRLERRKASAASPEAKQGEESAASRGVAVSSDLVAKSFESLAVSLRVAEGSELPRVNGLLPNAFLTVAVTLDAEVEAFLKHCLQTLGGDSPRLSQLPPESEFDQSDLETGLLGAETEASAVVFRQTNPRWNAKFSLRTPTAAQLARVFEVAACCAGEECAAPGPALAAGWRRIRSAAESLADFLNPNHHQVRRPPPDGASMEARLRETLLALLRVRIRVWHLELRPEDRSAQLPPMPQPSDFPAILEASPDACSFVQTLCQDRDLGGDAAEDKALGRIQKVGVPEGWELLAEASVPLSGKMVSEEKSPWMCLQLKTPEGARLASVSETSAEEGAEPKGALRVSVAVS